MGKRLAEQLGIPFYDQELIELAVQSSPIDREHFENAETSGVGSLLYDLAADVRRDRSIQDKTFLHQSGIIREIAEKGSCVIVGRCADYVLKNNPSLLRVFIYADPESRKYRIEHVYHESPGTEEEQLLKTDKKRAAYYQHYTGRKFGDAQNYDICLNSGMLGIEECVKLIQDACLDKSSGKGIE